MDISKNVQDYVVGFLFDKSCELVLLQHKKGGWQDGKFNGPGGKIEVNETPLDAMVREYREETQIENLSWTQYATLHDCRGYRVHFFFARTEAERLIKASGLNVPELLFPVRVDGLRRCVGNILPNVEWLVNLAISIAMGRERVQHFDILEHTEVKGT